MKSSFVSIVLFLGIIFLTLSTSFAEESKPEIENGIASPNQIPLHQLCPNLPDNQDATDKAYNDIRCSCREKYKDLIDSSGLGNMKEGNNQYASCIKDNIVNLSKDFFLEKEYSRKEFLYNLENSESNYRRIINGIFSQNKSCRPYCGMDMEVFASVLAFQFNESLLYQFVQLRVRENMGVPKLEAHPK
ncbi:MAG: hypothetical protein EYC62_01045 [Alphaproteobacteria bacterium]|nr:MAG: hypothetical protein EYC62_01045 [Alphaproteobacteria bacterium]